MKRPVGGGSEETSEHQKTCKGFAVLYCIGLWSVVVWLFCVWSSAVESSGVSGRQKAQPYRKASDELFAFEVRLQTLKPFLFTY
jgi:hypothetical protein